MNHCPFSLFVTLFLFTACTPEKPDRTISLAGEWTVRLDSANVGRTENWANATLEGQLISLPATLDEAGIGTPDTLSAGMNNFVLSSLRRKYEYIGKAWYQCRVTVPEDWAGKNIGLFLERVLWTSEIFIDGRPIGTANSLIAPHQYDLSEALAPGEHLLTVVIDNSNHFPLINVEGDKYPDPTYREMAHAYTNHTQIKWNGILGRMEMTAREPTAPANLQVYTEADGEKLRFTFAGGAPEDMELTITDKDGATVHEQALSKLTTTDGESTLTIDRPNNVKKWDEFAPNLYTAAVTSVSGTTSARFGVRTVTNHDGLLTLNGHQIFLRGNLECSIFPLTGHPPLNKAEWAELIAQAKNYGLNHLRFHSWCPPAAAFEVADEAGFYLQAELPHWSLAVGEDAATTEFLRAEGRRMMQAYGNHPSFILMALGNELQGDAELLNEMVRELKAIDDRHLYATTAFSFQKPMGTRPEPEDEFFVAQWTRDGWIRGQGVFNDFAPSFDKDFREASSFVKIPIITHEIGQYSVYPAMDEIKKYTGVLRPLNFISIRKELERKGMLDDAPRFTQASGKLAAMLYKEEIERALKTPNISGFQLLQLQDFPGQGTALVGLLDAFWESKGAISGEKFRRFNSEIVPLLRFERATYIVGDTLRGTMEIANFRMPMPGVMKWSVKTEGGDVLAGGETEHPKLPLGVTGELGEVVWPVQTDKAQRLTIEVALESGSYDFPVGEAHPYRNSWNIWVYPNAVETEAAEVLVTTDYYTALRALNAGNKVLLNPAYEKLAGVKGRFVPVFWSPVHFPDQPATMGLLVEDEHPALADFPTENHTQWQWWDLTKRSTSVIVDSMDVTPIVRVIDNFVTNRRLASIFETKVGEGKLIFSSMDLTSDLDERPVARQLRASLVEYMAGDGFAPTTKVNAEALRKLRIDYKLK